SNFPAMVGITGAYFEGFISSATSMRPPNSSSLVQRKWWSTALLILIFMICQASVLDGPRVHAQTASMLQPATEPNYQARPYQGRLEPDDGQWIRPAKDYASTRYSSLDQINASNAKTLKLAFTFSTGMTRGHEAA